jgi:3-oxoacyl-(acyl-carrier-protein) synthase
MRAMTRVAVTGMGVVSPLGNAAAAVFANAQAGRSAIHRLRVPFASRLAAPLVASASFDADEHFEPPKRRMLDRVSQFALVAASQALGGARDALRQLDRSRAGVFVGTGMGGSQTSDDGYKTLYGDDSDRIKPFTVLMGMHNAPAAWIGIEHDLRGPNLTYSTACSSSAVAIGEAWRRVAGGDLEVAIAGGAEAPLSFGSLKAWEALHTLAAIDAIDPSASCKPFSKNRSGMVLGEGAAMLVLEPWERAVARGASIHGEILGYGLSTDVSHITRPSVEGQAAAMHAALRAAAIAPSAVDAINAHGTGTQANDAIETAAIKAVFGEQRRRYSDQCDEGAARTPAGRSRCARMRAVAAGHGERGGLADDAPAGAGSGVRPRLCAECGPRNPRRADDAVELVRVRGNERRPRPRCGVVGGAGQTVALPGR